MEPEHRKRQSALPQAESRFAIPDHDGNHIWTFTGAGTLTAFDMSGKQLWRREIQKDYGQFGLNHGYGSSPLLHNERLYVQVLHGMKTDDPSYVFAVDAKTGKTVWKVDRWTDAVAESPDDYSTPILVTVDGKQQLVVSGGDYVTGHDLDTGKELWRMGGLNPENGRMYRTIASSITTGGTILPPAHVASRSSPSSPVDRATSPRATWFGRTIWAPMYRHRRPTASAFSS